MNKAILFIIFMSIGICGFAQDTATTKLKFHSVSFSFGVHSAGLYFSFDAGMQTGPHIFRAFILGASEIISFGGGPPPVTEEYDILYGREFRITDWLYVDGNAGIGYLVYYEKLIEQETIGFPLLSRIRFQLGNTYGMGIQIHTNINNGKSIFSSGIFFQWKF